MEIFIKPFEPKYRDGVVAVLENLWPWDVAERYARFDWEYLDNPNHEKNLAVVAINEKDEVIGFRGWVPGIVCSNGKKYLVARAADAVVSPYSRKQGVFHKMTTYSLEYLEKNGVDAILNLTSNSQSNPGNLKLGWQAIGQLNIWYRFVLSFKKKQLNEVERIRKGKYQIEVTPNIPKGLRINYQDSRIAFSMNDGQLDWYSNMPGEKFITTVARDSDGKMAGVLVFKIAINTKKSVLFYLNVKDEKLAKVMFKEAKRYLPTGLISVWGMALNEDKVGILKRVGFFKIPFYEKLRKKPPILVRCMNNPEEHEGWLLGGKDIRDINNWELLSIDMF